MYALVHGLGEQQVRTMQATGTGAGGQHVPSHHQPSLSAPHATQGMHTSSVGSGHGALQRAISHSSMWEVALAQARQHGWRYFTRGFMAQQQHAFLTNAVIFAAYEHAAEATRIAISAGHGN